MGKERVTKIRNNIYKRTGGNTLMYCPNQFLKYKGSLKKISNDVCHRIGSVVRIFFRNQIFSVVKYIRGVEENSMLLFTYRTIRKLYREFSIKVFYT